MRHIHRGSFPVHRPPCTPAVTRMKNPENQVHRGRNEKGIPRTLDGGCSRVSHETMVRILEQGPGSLQVHLCRLIIDNHHDSSLLKMCKSFDNKTPAWNNKQGTQSKSNLPGALCNGRTKRLFFDPCYNYNWSKLGVFGQERSLV